MIITTNFAFEGIEGVVNGNQEQYARAAGEESCEAWGPALSAEWVETCTWA